MTHCCANTDGLTEASTGVGRKRYDDKGALLRFAKSHSPTTRLAIVDAIHRLLAGLGSGAEDGTAVLGLGVGRIRAAGHEGGACARGREVRWHSS